MLEAILSNLINEALESDPTTTTMIAAHLNYTMAHSQSARDAYRAQWGVEWSPLGNGASVSHRFATPSQVAITIANGSK